MGKFLGTYMQTCIIKILGNNFQQQLQHPITKKADAEPKKSRSNKKSRCRTSLLKNGPTKLPCLLIILASWVDFFDIGLLLYPVPHHTLQCCTRKSFWVTRTGESKLFCIGFSLFWSRCRTWCNLLFFTNLGNESCAHLAGVDDVAVDRLHQRHVLVRQRLQIKPFWQMQKRYSEQMIEPAWK